MRLNPNNNEFVGFCFNHKSEIDSIKFNDIFSLLNLCNSYKENKIYLSKEALCLTTAKKDSIDIMHYPICFILICSHTLPELEDILYDILDRFKVLNPNAILVL